MTRALCLLLFSILISAAVSIETWNQIGGDPSFSKISNAVSQSPGFDTSIELSGHIFERRLSWPPQSTIITEKNMFFQLYVLEKQLSMFLLGMDLNSGIDRIHGQIKFDKVWQPKKPLQSPQDKVGLFIVSNNYLLVTHDGRIIVHGVYESDPIFVVNPGTLSAEWMFFDPENLKQEYAYSQWILSNPRKNETTGVLEQALIVFDTQNKQLLAKKIGTSRDQRVLWRIGFEMRQNTKLSLTPDGSIAAVFRDYHGNAITMQKLDAWTGELQAKVRPNCAFYCEFGSESLSMVPNFDAGMERLGFIVMEGYNAASLNAYELGWFGKQWEVKLDDTGVYPNTTYFWLIGNKPVVSRNGEFVITYAQKDRPATVQTDARYGRVFCFTKKGEKKWYFDYKTNYLYNLEKTIISPDSKLVALVFADKTVIILDTDSGKMIGNPKKFNNEPELIDANGHSYGCDVFGFRLQCGKEKLF